MGGERDTLELLNRDIEAGYNKHADAVAAIMPKNTAVPRE